MKKNDDDAQAIPPADRDPQSDAPWLAALNPSDYRDKDSPGRKPGLTREVIIAVGDGIAAGLPNKYAAMAAGISERSFYAWLKAGRSGEAPELYAQFVRVIESARAHFVRTHLAIITTASAGGDVSSAKWLLANLDPAAFGSRQHLTVAEGDPESPAASYSIEDLREAEERGRDRAASTRTAIKAGGRRPNPLEHDDADDDAKEPAT